jgi:hypothetical protein
VLSALKENPPTLVGGCLVKIAVHIPFSSESPVGQDDGFIV